MGKVKKTILFIVVFAAILGGALAFNKCSKVNTFESERTYVFKSATLFFENDYDKYLILDGRTEQEYINNYAGLKQTCYVFEPKNVMYAPIENAVSYSMYYEYSGNKITVYDSKKKEEKLMEFTMSGNEIRTRLYYFMDIGSGKSYFDAVFVLE